MYSQRRSSCISNGSVLRLEESRQQAVNPEQPVSRQRDQIAARRQQSLGGERPERRLEAIEHGHAVLALEVRWPDRAELQLQDELPDQLLLLGGTKGARERQDAGLHAVAVRLVRVEVLHVDAVHVAKRRDAQSPHVG